MAISLSKLRKENSQKLSIKDIRSLKKLSTPIDKNAKPITQPLSTPFEVEDNIVKLPTAQTVIPVQQKKEKSATELPVYELNQPNQNGFYSLPQRETAVRGSKGIDISQILKVPENFKDGYQFGDITKTIGSTALDLGTSATKGIFSLGEGIGDLAQYGVAQVGDWLGADDFADQLRKNAQQDVTSMIFNPAENMYGKNSVAGETTTQVAEGVGNVLGMAYGGGVLPKSMRTIGKGAFKIPTTSIVSSMGGGMTEAYNNGATDTEAWLYGLGSGFAEGFSESLFGGLGSKFANVYGGGALDDVLIKNVTNRITNSTMRTLAQSGLKAVGEGAEEVISGLGSAIAKKLTYLSDEEFSKIVQDENLLEQFVMGTLTSAIMQVPSTVNAVKNGTEYIGELQKNIESSNTQNAPKTVYDLVQQEQNSQNSVNLPIVDNNGNIVNSNKFQYVKSDNTKVDNLRKSANKYFNNSVETQNLVNTIEKVIADKDYNVVFDDSIKNKKGQSVNAQITTNKNGEIDIKINPNSPRAGEFLLTHEITHAIETDSMKKLIIDYASKNSEFNQALESLKQTYGINDVSSEVVADISGQLFGNQEFINSLSMEQPSIFKKIYNKIIELANKITGNSRGALFIRDLKNKWENAYRNTTMEQAIDNISSNTQYHISQNASIDIDNVLNDINERNPVRLRDYTPDILVQNGIKNLPMYENPSHIRKNILTAKEAQNLGLSVMPNDNYHGLGKDLYIKAIDSLDNPRVIFKNKSNKDYLILTTLKDNSNNNIVVPIEIETNTYANRVKIDTNRIKSVYGRKNLNTCIKNNINQKELIKIYEQKKEQGTGIIPAASSFSANNITQSNLNVNSSTSTNILCS